MKKKLLSSICALVLILGLTPAAGALEGETLRTADALSTLGIVRGGYDLEAPATRAQGLSILVRLSGGEKLLAGRDWPTPFQDVTGQTAQETGYGVSYGWIYGDGGSFRPDAPLTANAWAAMLLRMLGYRDADGDFAIGDAALFAQRIGLFFKAYSGELRQSELFRSAYDALSFAYREGGDTVIRRLISFAPEKRAAANALGLLDETFTARQAAQRLMPAVFRLEMFEDSKQIEKKEPSANASGFFITGDGVAVTCHHCIESAIYGQAILATGEVFPVEEVLYYDADADLAVLRIARTSQDGKRVSEFPTLTMTDTGDVFPGETVYTLGNPLGLGLAVSSGIVSAIGRVVDAYSLPCIMNTADISKGSSGGALLDVYGHAIGITTGAYAQGNNMYLAVPVDPIVGMTFSGKGFTLEEVVRRQQNGLISSQEE